MKVLDLINGKKFMKENTMKKLKDNLLLLEIELPARNLIDILFDFLIKISIKNISSLSVIGVINPTL